MKKIIDLIEGKPSKALQAMVDGLRKQSKRKDFEISMSTFGAFGSISDPEMCYGCAATCTLQELGSKNLSYKTIDDKFKRAIELQFDIDETWVFELAMDDARVGTLDNLFSFCDKIGYFSCVYNRKFELRTSNWEEQLPQVEELIKELQSKRL